MQLPSALLSFGFENAGGEQVNSKQHNGHKPHAWKVLTGSWQGTRLRAGILQEGANP